MIHFLSSKSIQRVQANLIYFDNKIELIEINEKYLLNFKVIKVTKSYLLNEKKVNTILEEFIDLYYYIGKPSIFHIDNGGEFTANIIQYYDSENNIKIITV